MKLIIYTLLLLCPLLGITQPNTSQRKIVDETGAPVSNATVLVKGTGHTMITDKEGLFSSDGISPADTLVISAAGYQTARLSLADIVLFTITLKRKTIALDNVVIYTGYEQLRRERVSGSFETVGNKQLNEQISTDILSRLEGTSTLLFDKNSRRPEFTVRGVSSIIGSQDPLIVVDNFPYEGNLSNINPNDIENVTILKDAAAASIWGTRAGNGVVVITTKKAGFKQPLKVELTSNISIRNKPDLFYLPVMSPAEFIEVEQFLFDKGNYTSRINNINRPALSPVIEQLIRNANGQVSDADVQSFINSAEKFDVRNDFNKYIYHNALNSQQALTVKGGSEVFNFLLSGGFDKNVNELSAGYERVTLRSANSFRIGTKWSFSTGVTFTQTFSRTGKQSFEAFRAGTGYYYPYARLADDDGNALPIARYRQTYIDTAGGGKLMNWEYYPLEDYKHNIISTKLQSILATASLGYKPFRWVDINLQYQLEKQNELAENHQGIESFYTRDLINRFSQLNRSTGVVTYRVPKGGILDRNNSTIVSQNIRLQANMKQKWNIHELSALMGAEIREVAFNQYGFRTYGYNDEILTFSQADAVNPYPTFITGANAIIPANNSVSGRTNRFVSLFANTAYTFKQRYVFTASMRKDASNMFGVNTNDRWNPFWSTGISWSVSEEQFYKLAAIPSLKLRISYGYSGNVDQSRSAVTTLSYSGNAAANTGFAFASISQYMNPDLRWEKTGILNVGLDFSLLNRSLYGGLEFYWKNGSDLYGNSPVDYTTGLGTLSIVRNVADMNGSGLDIILSSDWLNKSIKWSTSLLFSYSVNKVKKYFISGLNGSAYLNNGSAVSALEGRPVYSIISLRWGGLDSLGNPQGYANKEKTTNYTSILGTGTTIDDLVFSGSAIPTIYGSLNNSINWKRWNLSINIMYKLGYWFRRESVNYSQLLTLTGSGHSDYSMRWKNPGDERVTHVPSFIYPNPVNRDAVYNNSEILAEKGDHIRLQYLNLGYQFTKRDWNKLPVDNLNLFVIANNLGFIWRANKKEIDPEYNSSVIPPGRIISFGIKTTF